MILSRRSIFGMAASAGIVAASRSIAQENSNTTQSLFAVPRRSTVSLIHGEDRRKNVTTPNRDRQQIRPVLKN